MKPEVLTLDIETYYDRDYSLSKLTTEEYIRSPLFEIIGLSIKQADWPAYWHPRPMVQGALKAVDWSNKIVVCQNTMFDGAALSWLYGIKPLAWVDIMGMSRALFPHEKSHSLAAQAQRMGVGAKGDAVQHALGKHYADFSQEELAAYGEYCNNDVELTYELFTKYMAMGFPRRELEVIDMILRMYIEPCLRLDKVRLHDHLNQTIAEKQQLLLRLLGMSETGTAEEIKSRLMSNDQFALMLRKLGVEPPMKVSPTTGKQTYAFAKTDPDFQALLEHDSLEVQALVAARLGNKSTLEETRTQRFISIADRGTLPVPLRYYAAHTGRKGGCLVAETAVTVYDPDRGCVEKRIVDVLPDDLVWDGLEFVPHDGVQFSGFQEVITWDNVTGTPDHVVFTDAGEISLRDALQGGHRIQTPNGPSKDQMDTARQLSRKY